MTQVAVRNSESTAVARPLKVLVPLIKEDLQQAEMAGMPYYRAAGEKLLEAKPQMPHGQFQPWITRNFGVKKAQASVWMRLAKTIVGQKSAATDFLSLGDFIRKTGPDPNYNTFASRKPEWQEPVRQVVNRVDVSKLAQERQDREKEGKLQRDLALRLIDIGYKVLATKLHPDKGGSREAMARLNRVRETLKHCVR